MAAPFEIVAAPLSLYLAPVGTAFPKIDTLESAFPGTWVKVGTNGQNSMTDVGVTVTNTQTIVEFTPVGSTAPVKAFRTDEKLEIGVTLADISAAQYAAAMNNATVTTVAATTGVAGESYFQLQRGGSVAVFALIARGISPANDTLNCQFQVPSVYQSANPSPVFKKGTPAELSLTFTTLLVPGGAGGFGEFHVQTAAHL